MKPLPLLFTLLLGCAENAGFVIDDRACTPEQVITIEETLRDANRQLFGGRYALKVIGHRHEWFGLDDDTDLITCSPYSWEDVQGWYKQDDILIYTRPGDMETQFKVSLLHELGHYVSGKMGHCEAGDGCCVMVEYMDDPPSEYCDGDLEFLGL